MKDTISKLIALLLLASPLAAQQVDTVVTPRTDSTVQTVQIAYTAYRDSSFYTYFTVYDTAYVPRPTGTIPQSLGCTNEPSGYRQLTYQPFDSLPSHNWKVNAGAASVFVQGSVVAGRFVGGARYDGRAPFAVYVPFSTPVKSVYSCRLVRTSVPWQMSPDISGNKSFFLTGGDNNYVNFATSVQFNTQHGGRYCNGVKMVSRLGPRAYPVGVYGDGQFHREEILIEGNPIHCEATGTVTIWLDGVLKVKQSGVIVHTRYSGFTGLNWSPTHGGCAVGPCINPITQDMLVSDWYISGR